MLDKPASRADWDRKAAALAIEARAFIDGRHVAAASGRTFAKASPIDGRHLADVADCDAADIDRAVAAARAAFEDGRWRDLPPSRRSASCCAFPS